MDRLQPFLGNLLRQRRLTSWTVEDTILGTAFQHIVYISLLHIIRQFVSGDRTENFSAAQAVLALVNAFEEFHADEVEDLPDEWVFVGDEAFGAGPLIGGLDAEGRDPVFHFVHPRKEEVHVVYRLEGYVDAVGVGNGGEGSIAFVMKADDFLHAQFDEILNDDGKALLDDGHAGEMGVDGGAHEFRSEGGGRRDILEYLTLPQHPQVGNEAAR